MSSGTIALGDYLIGLVWRQNVVAILGDLSGQRFSNLKRGKGLTCATGHDELATGIGLKALQYVGECLLLIRTQLVLHQLDLAMGKIVRPINIGALQLRACYDADWLFAVEQFLAGSCSEQTGIDKDAAAKEFLADAIGLH